VVSPLLANLYLHELDVEMRQAGLVMVRYADDAVVLCRTQEEAETALTRMRAWVEVDPVGRTDSQSGIHRGPASVKR
jgi:RNA-directed DNA polymerase